MKITNKARDIGILFGMGWLALSCWVASDPMSGDSLDVTYWGRIGDGHTIGGSSSNRAILIGSGNSSSSDCTLLVGSNLELAGGEPDSLVVGRWNDDAVTGALLVVGKGTSGTPANAFEVYEDGSIRIPVPQGDVSMGDFDD